MIKRAAIYIRVSTEKQTENYSPAAQEQECRELCEKQGYTIVGIYRDTEKYRSGRKMVEPSGTRDDRPQFRRLLADVDSGLVDVIVAWREDRLYRGLRPMLTFSETIDRNMTRVVLVRETFDPKMTTIKAAIARMEIDAIRERNALGHAARCATGKAYSSFCVPYGYKTDTDGYIVIHPDESVWVVRVNQWYADGLSLGEIRQKMIVGGAPQREHPSRKKARVRIDWHKTILQRFVTASVYRTGRQVIKFAHGRTIEIPCPVLINADLDRRVAERRERNKRHPARHKKYHYLIDGLAYCEGCQVKMQARTRIRSANWIEQSYVCHYHNSGYRTGDAGINCCKHVAVKKIDAEVWDAVWRVITDDEFFESRVQMKIDALRAQEQNAERELSRLNAVLDDLMIQRQKIISWGRTRKISEADMEMQLGELTIEESKVRKQIDEASLLVGDRAQRLINFANTYRARLRKGAQWLAAPPDTPEKAEKHCKMRREIADAIVTRVEINADKIPHVYFVFDTEELEGEPANSPDGAINSQPFG